jgi:hypothetical protein
MTMTLRRGVSATETDYGTTLLDEDSGEFFTLNPSGSLVLRTLLAGGTTTHAARALTEEYAVDAGTADRDVADLVAGLRSTGLVTER